MDGMKMIRARATRTLSVARLEPCGEHAHDQTCNAHEKNPCEMYRSTFFFRTSWKVSDVQIDRYTRVSVAKNKSNRPEGGSLRSVTQENLNILVRLSEYMEESGTYLCLCSDRNVKLMKSQTNVGQDWKESLQVPLDDDEIQSDRTLRTKHSHFGAEWCWVRVILTLSCSWRQAALTRLSLLRFAAEEVPARSPSNMATACVPKQRGHLVQTTRLVVVVRTICNVLMSVHTHAHCNWFNGPTMVPSAGLTSRKNLHVLFLRMHVPSVPSPNLTQPQDKKMRNTPTSPPLNRRKGA